MKDQEEILYDWISARESRLSAKRTLAGFTCEFYEQAEHDTGYPGVPRCRHSPTQPSEWCGQCQTRDRLWHGFQLLKKAERRAFAMLCRSALRLKKRHDQATSHPARVQSADEHPAFGSASESLSLSVSLRGDQEPST